MATTQVTLQQVAQLISVSGSKVCYFLQGEPGVGKSSSLGMIAEAHGDAWRKVGDVCPDDKYQYIYADCPLMDLPDFAMPVVEGRTTYYAPSDLWGFNDPRPKVIMLDEVSKAPNVVKPMFTRLMLEQCIGSMKLVEGSKVFATGNNASDGVGDTMQGHINNRVSRLGVGKPSAEAWINWGINNKVNEVILAAVHQFPHALQSYLDDPKGDNPYIFNPKKNTGAYVSPRSLFKAGHICDHRKEFGYELTQAALEGTVGVSFARDMMAFLDVADSIPSWEEIAKNPKKTPIPKSPAAQILLLFGSVAQVDATNAKAFTEYFFRFETELRMLWAVQFKTRLTHVMNVEAFRKTLTQDHWVFN